MFNDNYIETTESNADLDLRANGTGILSVPDNNVQVIDNVYLGTLNSVNINTIQSLSAEEFELSSNIKLYDNVITTTNSNSNLELRSLDSRITLENFRFKDTNLQTTATNITFAVNGNLIIAATGAINLPAGTTEQRQVANNRIRFNTTDNVFEAFNNSKVLSFNGVYSANRRTNVLTHPTNDIINFTINQVAVGNVDADGISIHGLDVDDILIQTNNIRTNVSNSDLELRSNGTGKLVLYSTTITGNSIQNNNAGALILKNTGYGKVKFNVQTGVVIPYGTTAEQQTVSPEVGLTRWNTQEQILETWDGNTYISAAGSSATISEAEMNDLILEYTLIFG